MSARDRLFSASPRLLSLVLAGVVGLVLIAGLLIIDLTGEELIARRQRLVAETARDYFVAFAHEEGLTPLADALDRRARQDIGAFRYAVYGDDGRLLGGVPLLPAPPKVGFSTVRIDEAGGPQTYEALVQPISTGGVLVIYENLSDRSAFHRAILAAGGAALLLSLALVAAASVWLGAVLVRRTRGMANAAERIAGGDLSARAPAGPGGDAFDDLARAINGMLERIEELMIGMRTVTDSLAHDLRSPLSRLSGSLTRALDPALSEAARLDLIEAAEGESRQVLATFGALLDIARAEAGVSREMMAEVDLNALITDVGELFSPAIEDADQRLTVTDAGRPLSILGHELMLRQAIGNLLHNATRYAGPGATIELNTRVDASAVRITVADDGPGVPAADLHRVGERFVRLDESRGAPGSGLGLAIAAACAKLHGGRLMLEDHQPGLRAVMEIPI